MGNWGMMGAIALTVAALAESAGACEIEIETRAAELRSGDISQKQQRERLATLLYKDPGNLGARYQMVQLLAAGAKAGPADAEHLLWLIEACPKLAHLTDAAVLTIRDPSIERAWFRAERLHPHPSVHQHAWKYRLASRPPLAETYRPRVVPRVEISNQQSLLRQNLERYGDLHPKVKRLARKAYRASMQLAVERLRNLPSKADFTEEVGELLIYAAQSAQLAGQERQATRIAAEVLVRSLWVEQADAYAVLIRVSRRRGDKALEDSLSKACDCNDTYHWPPHLPRRRYWMEYPW